MCWSWNIFKAIKRNDREKDNEMYEIRVFKFSLAEKQ